jgi:hypothetical protein
VVRIERCGSDWVLVDGRAPSEARWRLRGERVELVSPSGRAYVVPNGDVPFDVALGLLALRDAARFLSSGSSSSTSGGRAAGESAGAFALRAWLETSRDPLLADRVGSGLSGVRTPSWMDYRFTFLAATSLSSGEHSFGLGVVVEPTRGTKAR